MWSNIQSSMFGMGIGVAIGLITGIISAFAGPYIKTKEADKSMRGLLYLWKNSAWQTIVLTIILGPIAEEFVFRFLGISLLAKIVPGVWPILITAVLFGLAHNQYPMNIISGILGLILGIIYWYFGLVASILMHAVQNGVVVLHLWWRFQKRTGETLTSALKRFNVEETIKYYETGEKPHLMDN